MTYFEFTQKFPEENSAIDFIVATSIKTDMSVRNVAVLVKGYTTKSTIDESYIATTVSRSFRLLKIQSSRIHILTCVCGCCNEPLNSFS